MESTMEILKNIAKSLMAGDDKKITEEVAKAIEDGMRTLRDDGWDKVAAGVTTIQEVLLVTEDNE